MATIISRLFADETTAQKAKDALIAERLPRRDIDVMSSADVDALASKGVLADSAAAYAGKMEAGQSLMVVRATYKPLMAAQITRDTLAKFETHPLDGHDEENWIPDGPGRSMSILEDHPRFLTMPPDPKDVGSRGLIFEGAGFRSLSRPKARTSAMRGGRVMSRAFWPMPLLSKKPRKNSVISGGRQMSRLFWPAKLISSKPRRNSAIRGGDTPFSRMIGWPTTT